MEGTLYSPPTSNEKVLFRERFENLSTFLACLHEEDPYRDALLVEEQCEPDEAEWLQEVMAEGRAFMAQRELPWRVIEHKANRLFGTEEHGKAWLTQMFERIEGMLRGERFKEKFGNLWDFMGQLHKADARSEGNYAVGLDNLLGAKASEWLRFVVAEGRELLSRRDFPWMLVAHACFRPLDTEDQTRAWLSGILDRADAVAEQRAAERQPAALH